MEDKKKGVILHSQSHRKGLKAEVESVKKVGNKFFESLKPKPGKERKTFSIF